MFKGIIPVVNLKGAYNMNKDEINLIKQAILNEIEGYEFYRLAARQADSEEIRESFVNLANEEMMHVEWLKELFVKITDTKEDTFTLSEIPNPPSPKLFKWENLDRANAGIAMSVFGIGMQMEQASIDFYSRALESTDNIQVKNLYKTLIAWEKVHLEQFSKEYHILSEDWWSDQGFSPF